MIRIGILGDIGSGKSYVAKEFGYPVFNADIEVLKWGETPEFNIIINATTLGLKKTDEIKLDYAAIGTNKLFYDVIYNPNQTNFLMTGKKLGNKTENGKLMFIYQAFLAFNLWHGVQPRIDDDVIKLLDQ